MKQQITKKNSSELRIITKPSDTLTCKPIINDDREAEKHVLAGLMKCRDSLGLSIDLGILQTIAEDLVDKYKYESIEDIMYCLKKGRQGYYGNNYNKLNLIVISEWMGKHLEEKAREREKIIQNRKKETLDKDTVIEGYVDLMNGEKPKSEKELISKANKLINKTLNKYK